ncbi:MAG TPA: MFS transporter [Dehalococcoidia bacterium]|nr:MFS transporter [Dehalococcoidia bacterium]
MTTDQTEPVLPGKVFIALGAAMFLVMGVSLMLGPLLVDLAEDFHTSVAVTGQLASATFIAWAIVAPLVGPISDSYGRRPIALTGLGLVTVGLVGSGLAVITK